MMSDPKEKGLSVPRFLAQNKWPAHKSLIREGTNMAAAMSAQIAPDNSSQPVPYSGETIQDSLAKLLPLFLAVTDTLCVTHGVAHAQVTPAATLAAGQTGCIRFETITLTDAQFLRGEKKGSLAIIWGDQRSLEHLTGRAPAVVPLHGTVGAGPRQPQWAAELNRLKQMVTQQERRPNQQAQVEALRKLVCKSAPEAELCQ